MKKIFFIIVCSFLLTAAFAQPTLSPDEKEGTDLYKAGKSAEAIASFKKALSANPSSLYALNALGNLYLLRNNNQDAYEVADKGIKLSGGAGNFIVTKSKAAIKLGKAAEALTLMDNYLQKNEPDFMLLFVKANALAALNDQQQALLFYSKSITANPGHKLLKIIINIYQ